MLSPDVTDIPLTTCLKRAGYFCKGLAFSLSVNSFAASGLASSLSM